MRPGNLIMADTLSSSGLTFAARPPSGEFQILKIYTKDLSFETPHSPGIFSVEWKPDADVNLRSAAVQAQTGEYEVTLTITITVTVGERTAFLAEVQQAGIFNIVGVTSEELDSVIGAYCPAILYPYAREVISDMVVRGGFPPFVLSPVNFDALYTHHKADQQQGAADPGA